MSSEQLVPLNQKVSTIRALMERSKGQIAMALPKHMNADRLMRVAMTSIQKTPKLLDCTPQSLMGAIIQSAQLGLEPDGILGHAYLVPYGNVCTFIPGYKGLIQLARRSGEISTIMAEVVHAKDHFEFELGLEPKLKHVPTPEEDEGEIVAFYAVAKLKDGGTQFVVMRRAAVEKIRKRSKAANNGPWVTDYEEMGKKTTLRRLCKLLPSSIELEQAIALDERAEVGLPQEIDVIPEGQEAPRPVSRLEQIADRANVQGESVDAAEVADICDADDWNDIDQAAQLAGVKMARVIEHITGTMGCKPSEALPKARKGEVLAWINAQPKKAK